jgi:tetratricopeptide (TPR) repeat protein
MPDRFPIVAMIKASVYARLGDRDAAAEEFGIATPHVEEFSQDPDFSAFAAEAAALVGSRSICETLLETLRRNGPRECVMGHVGMTYEGPSGRAIGLLESALGEKEAALRDLEAALELTAQRGQRPYAAQIGYEVGRVLVDLGREPEARVRFEHARSLATELGMVGLVNDLESKLASQRAPDVEANAGATATAPAFSLLPAGDAWRCRFRAREFFVKTSRGLSLLARLIERPSEEIHALVLAADDGEPIAETSAGEQLDEQAVRAYRARLRELGDEVDEAEHAADRARFEKLSRERDALVAELSRAVGLGGRNRKAGSATERARVNVQKRLKDAIVRVGEVDAEAGRYLGQAVRTGSFCSFRP